MKTKQRSTVVNQVELRIPSPSNQLEVPFPFTIRQVTPTLHDYAVGLGKNCAYGLGKLQQLLEIEATLTGPQVVEEDPADAPPLLPPVRIHEVVIAPGLEPGVEVPLVALTRRLESAMKVTCVVWEWIGRSEIGAPSKPCIDRFAGGTRYLEVTDV